MLSQMSDQRRYENHYISYQKSNNTFIEIKFKNYINYKYQKSWYLNQNAACSQNKIP